MCACGHALLRLSLLSAEPLFVSLFLHNLTTMLTAVLEHGEHVRFAKPKRVSLHLHNLAAMLTAIIKHVEHMQTLNLCAFFCTKQQQC